MSAWQDIATAPKDGSSLLAINRHSARTDPPVVVVFIAAEDAEDGDPHWGDAATCGEALYYNELFFSHWQPLPEPPPRVESST